MKYLFLILFLTIVGYNQGQQIYFESTLYEYSRSCLASDIIRVDSTNYLVAGRYSIVGAPTYIGAEYINKLDEYGNVIDSIKFEHKKDSAGIYYEIYYEHYFAEGLNGDYFSGQAIRDTMPEYIIELVKHSLNHDTILKTYLHSNIDPVDSLWPNSWKEYIHREMKATLDGGVIIMAITNGLYQSMSVVTKVDSIGNIEWEYKIKNDSLGGYPLYSGISLAVLPDSTYIAAYETHEGIWDWSNHIILKKLDKNGNVLKTKSIGNGEENRQPHIRYNPLDTHLYLAYVKEYFGDNSAPGPHENYLKPNIMKLDTEFNIKWNKSYGRAPYYIPNYSTIKYANYGVYDFQLDKKGNMTYLGIVIDHTSLVNHRSLNYLFQLDSNGDSLWFKAYDFPNISGNELTGYGFSQFVQNDDMGFTISTNISTDSFQYGLVFRVDSMGCPDPTCRVAKVVDVELPKNDIVVYPNPATTHITIDWQQPNAESVSLQIFSSTGRLVQSFGQVRAGQELSVEQLSPGIYLLEGLNAKGERFVGKFVKE